MKNITTKELAVIRYVNEEECIDTDVIDEYIDALTTTDDPSKLPYMENEDGELMFEGIISYDEIDMDMNNDRFEYGGSEYLILDDDEADIRWDDELDYYIDECIMPEIHENYQSYFDREKWKRDARHDGRGHSIATYDGDEREVEHDGETFYIYRMN